MERGMGGNVKERRMEALWMNYPAEHGQGELAV